MNKKTKFIIIHVVWIIVAIMLIGGIVFWTGGGFSKIIGPRYPHDNKDYADISTINYSAVLKSNGDLEVEEIISFDIKAKSQPFRELYRELNLTDYDINHNVSYDLDSIKLSQINDNGITVDFPFKKNNPNRTPGFFNLWNMNAKKGHLMEVRWYINMMSGQPVYKLNYTFKNVLRKYSDAAELNICLFSTGSINYLNSYSASIKFPTELTQNNNFKLYHHNQPNGKVSIDADNINYTVTNPVYNVNGDKGFIELRAVMDATALAVFEDSQHVSEKYTYNSILQEEDDWLKKLENYESSKVVFTIIDILLALAIVGFGVFWYFYNKNKTFPMKFDFSYKYNKQIPSEIDAFCAALLVSKFQKINCQPVAAAIIKLSAMKMIRIEKQFNDSEYSSNNMIFFFTSDDKNLKEKSDDFEMKVYDYLYNISGNKTSITMDEIIENARTLEGYKKQLDLYGFLNNRFDAMQLVERPKEIKYRKTFTAIGGFLGFIAYFFIGKLLMPTFYGFAFFAGLALLGTATFCLVSAFPKYIATKLGAELYYNCNGLYNFFKDLTSINKSEIIAIERWDNFLVYATAFGIAENVTDALNLHLPNKSEDARQFYNNDYFGHMYLLRSLYYFENTRFYSPPATTSSSGGDWGGDGGGGSSSGGGGGGSGGGGGGGRH